MQLFEMCLHLLKYWFYTSIQITRLFPIAHPAVIQLITCSLHDRWIRHPQLCGWLHAQFQHVHDCSCVLRAVCKHRASCSNHCSLLIAPLSLCRSPWSLGLTGPYHSSNGSLPFQSFSKLLLVIEMEIEESFVCLVHHHQGIVPPALFGSHVRPLLKDPEKTGLPSVKVHQLPRSENPCLSWQVSSCQCAPAPGCSGGSTTSILIPATGGETLPKQSWRTSSGGRTFVCPRLVGGSLEGHIRTHERIYICGGPSGHHSVVDGQQHKLSPGWPSIQTGQIHSGNHCHQGGLAMEKEQLKKVFRPGPYERVSVQLISPHQG